MKNIMQVLVFSVSKLVGVLFPCGHPKIDLIRAKKQIGKFKFTILKQEKCNLYYQYSYIFYCIILFYQFVSLMLM